MTNLRIRVFTVQKTVQKWKKNSNMVAQDVTNNCSTHLCSHIIVVIYVYMYCMKHWYSSQILLLLRLLNFFTVLFCINNLVGDSLILFCCFECQLYLLWKTSKKYSHLPSSAPTWLSVNKTQINWQWCYFYHWRRPVSSLYLVSRLPVHSSERSSVKTTG